MKDKRVSKAKQVSLDRITMLPQNLLETVLCLLSNEEAVRTSILSREWRFKWTKIPKLAFVSRMTRSEYELRSSDTERERARKDRMSKIFCVMHQILLQRQAPILEFSVSIDPPDSCFELDQIILHLARNHTVKKLSLEGRYFYKLPFSVFSMHHLTDLYLSHIELNHKPVFSGFGSLSTLHLKYVKISIEALLHLLSNCTSLKCLSLVINQGDISGNMSPVIKLSKFLPAIEHLTICTCLLPWLVLDAVPEELPTPFIHLKYFCFEEFCFDDGRGLTFLVVLIKSSPYLEKLKLKTFPGYDCYDDETCSVELDEYSDFLVEHLNELEIVRFSNSKREMEFVKFILARSPKLKKMRIRSVVEKNDEFEMFTSLLRASRASPVDIIVERFSFLKDSFNS